MPASPMENVRDAIVTLLSTVVDGTGTYTYDLTGTGAVVNGAPPDSPMVAPVVYVWAEQSLTPQGPELGDYENQQQITLMGFVPGIDDTPAGRVTAAERLGYDLFLAFRSDRSLSATVNDCQFIGWNNFDGQQFGNGLKYGACVARVDVRYFLDGVPD